MRPSALLIVVLAAQDLGLVLVQRPYRRLLWEGLNNYLISMGPGLRSLARTSFIFCTKFLTVK